jgi:hypothetical protein
MQAADFMCDVAGSDHAVLVLKDWRDRTQEDLLAEVADDLGFGVEDDGTLWSFEGGPEIPLAQAESFFASVGLNLNLDLILAVKDWRDCTRDGIIAELTRDVDQSIADDAGDEQDDEALLEADIAQALYDSIDAQIEAKLAESQKLREEAEEMIDQMRRTRGDVAPAGLCAGWVPPIFKTQAEFNADLNKRWNRGDFSPFNW